MRHSREDPLRTRRGEELEQRDGDTRAEPFQPATAFLALQRSVGNQAVSALLARAPRTAPRAGEKGAEASGPRATLSGIGTIPILSVNLEGGRGVTGGQGGEGREGREGRGSPREIVVASRIGPHSAKLARAARDATAMDVEIVLPSGKAVVRLTLKDAIVGSYTPSGDDESWTLDFSAMTHSVEDEGDAGEAPREGEREGA